MAKNLQISNLLDFYGKMLTEKQLDVLEQYYYNDYSLSEIAENSGISRQGVRDAIKHGENSLLELEENIGFAKRYRTIEQKLFDLKSLVRDAKFSMKSQYHNYDLNLDRSLDKMLLLIEEMEETE